jgi:hypothetical protein
VRGPGVGEDGGRPCCRHTNTPKQPSAGWPIAACGQTHRFTTPAGELSKHDRCGGERGPVPVGCLAACPAAAPARRAAPRRAATPTRAAAAPRPPSRHHRVMWGRQPLQCYRACSVRSAGRLGIRAMHPRSCARSSCCSSGNSTATTRHSWGY